MTTMTDHAAPSATLTAPRPWGPGSPTPQDPSGLTAPLSVPPVGTPAAPRAPRRRAPVYCTGPCGKRMPRRTKSGLCRQCRAAANAPVPCRGQCHRMISPKNKSGRCRDCYRANRAGQCSACYAGGMARRCPLCAEVAITVDRRKTEPEEQFAMLARMAESAARRAAGEDPGRSLRLLLDYQERVDMLVDRVGFELAEQIGTSAMAADLRWRRQRADKRWGPDARRRKGW